MSETVLARIEQRLRSNRVEYEMLRHHAVYTSEEAAAVRGTTLASGAKALICKVDQQFVMLVLPADRKLDSKGLRKQQGWKSLRFADRDEVLDLTGLTPGSIPPFGSLFGICTLCDERLAENGSINFNAGDHCVSVSLTYEDYLRVETPTMAAVAI